MVGVEISVALEDAVPLGYALAERAGLDLGARILAIKGPVPEAHGLRRDHVSIDIDALVEPQAFERVLGRLAELGWHPMEIVDEPRIFAGHSKTLTHAAWPVTIDLHHTFPGLLADPEVVFDALWAERAPVEIAHQQVESAGVLGSTLIAAVHGLRHKNNGQGLHEVEQLVAFWTQPGRDTRPLLDLAVRTGCDQVLRGFFARLGVDVPEVADPGTQALLEQWELRRDITGTRGLGWIEAFRRTPWRGRPRVLWDSVMTDNELVLRAYGAGEDGSGAGRARLRRIRRALQDAPHVLRMLVRDRRALRGAREARKSERG